MSYTTILSHPLIELDREYPVSQLTLGDLIEQVRLLPPQKTVIALNEGCGYRGFHDDLGFLPRPTLKETTAEELASMLESLVGKTIQGHKGNEYPITLATLLWLGGPGQLTDLQITGISNQTGAIKIRGYY